MLLINNICFVTILSHLAALVSIWVIHYILPSSTYIPTSEVLKLKRILAITAGSNVVKLQLTCLRFIFLFSFWIFFSLSLSV